jgi:hypothetical protein
MDQAQRDDLTKIAAAALPPMAATRARDTLFSLSRLSASLALRRIYRTFIADRRCVAVCGDEVDPILVYQETYARIPASRVGVGLVRERPARRLQPVRKILGVISGGAASVESEIATRPASIAVVTAAKARDAAFERPPRTAA